MITKLQIFTIALLIIAMLFMQQKIRKSVLSIRVTLPWILLIIVMLIITAFPNIAYKTAELLGIQTPSNLLFYIGFLLTLGIIYFLSAEVSRQSEQIRKMAQTIALMQIEKKEKTDEKEI